MAHAYIAYSQADAPHAERIRAHFDQAGLEAWGDGDAERAGSHLPDSVQAAIANSFALIVLISENSVDAPQPREELDFALANSIPIFPVRLDSSELAIWWRSRISNTVALNASEGDDGYLDALLSGVRRFFDRLAPVIAVMNMKGGVGKTTVTAQVFAALQKRQENRVVIVDLDPQHNLSQLFLRHSTQETLIQMDASAISLFEPSSLQGEPSPGEDWHSVSRVDVAPPEPDQIARRLIRADRGPGRFDLVCGQFDIAKYAFLENKEDIDTARRNFICSIDILRENYDLVVLDTNPSASFLTRCAFAVASRILAPVRPDRFSLRGLRLLNEVMTRLLDEPGRPPMSVLFNGVERGQMTDSESQARAGEYDTGVGFTLSRALLDGRLHNSRFLAVRDEGSEEDPLHHLAIHRASGLWAGPLKDALNGIADELSDVSGLRTPARAA